MSNHDVQVRASSAATAIRQSLSDTRRDLHRIPEPGFCEFRTAAYIVSRLAELGWETQTGQQAMDANAAFSLPGDVMTHWFERAQAAVPDEQIRDMQGGHTAVVATRRFGDGPTVAFRFDIDGLPIQESKDGGHRPTQEGFASTNPGWMHACGHDGHATIGLGLAEVLGQLAPDVGGSVKLIFQPAEEGARGGAAAIAARGHLDDVDVLVCTHLGLNAQTTGTVVCGTTFMGTFKYRAKFHGRSAHVVLAPQDGRNALLAAASATLAIHGLPAHSDGWYSLNVGVLNAGTEQGVTPAHATIELGGWFDAPRVQASIRARVLEAIEATARAQGCQVEIQHIGEAPYVEADPDLGARLAQIALAVPSLHAAEPTTVCRAGEDATILLEHVRARSAQSAYVLVGSELASGHHTDRFDFDEEALVCGVAFLASVAACAKELD